MAEQQVTNLGSHDAPLTRITKDSEEFTLLNVKASFDGSAAGSAFVPAVRIVSDSGQEVGTYPADDQVAAGGSADATFAPFLRNKRGEIRYNRLNVGTWLNVRTTSNLNPDTGGVTFEVERSQFGVYVDAVTGDSIHFEAPFVYMSALGGIFRFENSSLFEVNATEVTAIATHAWSIANNHSGIDGTTSGDVTIAHDGDLFLNLPTVAPATSGALWNNAGTVKVVP